MEMQLDKPEAPMLKAGMEAMGVNVHLKKLTTGILGDDTVNPGWRLRTAPRSIVTW